MDEQKGGQEWSDAEMMPVTVKVIDVWQKRGKRIEILTKEDIEEAVLYKH